ncbi:MAG TPA: DUF1559 domain-containing protein, partial [Pirellulales bacterium]
CTNNLKQIGLAINNYATIHKYFPYGSVHANKDPSASANRAGWSWSAAILPQMEQQPGYDRLGVDIRTMHQAMLDANIRVHAQKPLAAFRCPSDTAPELNDLRKFTNANYGPSSLATSNYIANSGTRWAIASDWVNSAKDPWGVMWASGRSRPADVTDGLSNTFLVGERDWYGLAGVLYGTRNYEGTQDVGLPQVLGLSNAKLNDVNPDLEDDKPAQRGFSSRHPGGANFVFGDGRVMFINENIHFDNTGTGGQSAVIYNALGVYQRLSRRNDGVPLTGEL